MSATGEATVNPDGTTTTNTNAESNSNTEEQTTFNQSTDEQEIPNTDGDVPLNKSGTDPAIYLALSFITFVILYIIRHKRQKKKQLERESFFFDMDGDKFNIKLPEAVDEYYEIKEKCLKAGWEPGKVRFNYHGI